MGLWVGCLLVAAGCGQTPPASTTQTTNTTSPDSPQAIVQSFLDAAKKGHGDAPKYLTSQARKKLEEAGIDVAYPGSIDSTFKVGEFEIDGTQAQVAAEWMEKDDKGGSQSYTIIWFLKDEPTVGWRISGMATKVFADWERQIYNFEDVADMENQQKRLDAEIARRQAAATMPANPQTSQAPATPGTVQEARREETPAKSQ